MMKTAVRIHKKVWSIRPPHADTSQLADKLSVSPILAQTLINRQITDTDTARTFLSPKLTDLIPPEDMPGVTPAAARIKQALVGKEKIAIYGDYDVDGITSVSILWHLLTTLGAEVEYYIPHRIEEGYGLNEDAIKQLAENGAKLIITVDCGISAQASAKLAHDLGMELIITDHHRPDDTNNLPMATAIVHPSLDDSYPNPHSAGAMVAFKLAWAIANEFKSGQQLPSQLRQFLINATTLAAMGTIADVVDLRGENRIIASFGLKTLRQSKLTGIRAIIESSGLTGQNLDSYHIAFKLAPLLNAAGRMGHARLAVDLLTSESELKCTQIAEYLKEQNQQRQQLQRKIFKEAREMVINRGLNHPDKKTIVIAAENWHPGIIGIVASRIVETFLRPAIIICISGETAQGSARSVEGFNIHAAIKSAQQHLISFGGHEYAAGLRIDAGNIKDFAQAIEKYAAENFTSFVLEEKLDIDALCSVNDLNKTVVKELELLDPAGQGNRKPIFASRGVQLISPPRKVGAKGDHLQLSIRDNTGSVRCIGFNMGKLEKKLLETDYFSVAYEPKINNYNGNSSVQFVIEDIKFE